MRAPSTACPPSRTRARRRDDYFVWRHELLLYSDAIARLRGKPFFHFVQPNQYDRGSIDVLAGAVARHVAESGRLVPRESARAVRSAPRGFLERPASAHLKTESDDASEG